MGRIADKNKLRVCSFCKNEWSINEGYSLKTKQCAGCDVYDREEPIRKAEAERLRIWWETEGIHIHNYVGSRFINNQNSDMKFY